MKYNINMNNRIYFGSANDVQCIIGNKIESDIFTVDIEILYGI